MPKDRPEFDGWVKCCYECPKREKPEEKCYRGKSCRLCPEYKKACSELGTDLRKL